MRRGVDGGGRRWCKSLPAQISRRRSAACPPPKWCTGRAHHSHTVAVLPPFLAGRVLGVRGASAGAGAQRVLGLLGVRTSVDDIRVSKGLASCVAAPGRNSTRLALATVRLALHASLTRPGQRMRPKAAPSQPQGCAKGSPDVLLLQLAELVTAVEAHRGASGGGCGFLIGDSGAAASTLGPQQLMDAACELGPRVWCDTMQLFPRDMTPLMDEYRWVASPS